MPGERKGEGMVAWEETERERWKRVSYVKKGEAVGTTEVNRAKGTLGELRSRSINKCVFSSIGARDIYARAK